MICNVRDDFDRVSVCLWIRILLSKRGKMLSFYKKTWEKDPLHAHRHLSTGVRNVSRDSFGCIREYARFRMHESTWLCIGIILWQFLWQRWPHGERNLYQEQLIVSMHHKNILHFVRIIWLICETNKYDIMPMCHVTWIFQIFNNSNIPHLWQNEIRN